MTKGKSRTQFQSHLTMGPCEVSKRAKFLKGMFKRHRSGLSERRKDEEPAKMAEHRAVPQFVIKKSAGVLENIVESERRWNRFNRVRMRECFSTPWKTSRCKVKIPVQRDRSRLVDKFRGMTLGAVLSCLVTRQTNGTASGTFFMHHTQRTFKG